MDQELRITRVANVEARLKPMDWDWALRNREHIQANWQRRKAQTPKMYNGRVLMLRDLELTQERCVNTYFEVDYADLVAWIDLGNPDRSVANGFAMGALRGSDGAFICGVMDGHTANAGRIYFPAGTPDRSDVRPDGTVDLATSLTRELFEETGLAGADYRVGDEWIVVQRWPSVAMMRTVTLPVPAEEGAAAIRRSIAKQDPPELSDLKIVRGPEDIDPQKMPLFLQSFFRWSFGQL
ncbi:MAG TPA: NUDIX hydrolase [Microvirga sp.]|nr:NUDIX hydrolase [Microvirga sp.]